MLQIENLSFRIGERQLFDRAGVAIPDGHKVALVGRNGTGKTTLLSLIEGALEPESGLITMKPRTRIGAIAQFMPEGEASPLDLVLAADRERTDLLAAMATAGEDTQPGPGEGHEIAHVHARFADIGGHAAPSRAASILAGLGFDAPAQQRPISSFSGGWRMRVALAAVLFARPDLLLLDEPTNHLDLEATLWLEQFLARWPGTLIFVSHDRSLINRVADHTLHLEAGKLVLYRGGYDAFQRARAERMAVDRKAAGRLEARRQHMQAFVDRFRYKATKARQAQSRLKALSKMAMPSPVIDAPEVRFSFPDPEPLAPPLITLEGAAVGYDGSPVLRGLDLRIDMDDRIALLGANGNGKSTLTRLLAGLLPPMAGRRVASGKLRVGYFAQDQTEILSPDDSAIAHIARLDPDRTEERIRAHLGRFGLSGKLAESPAGTLSGGERVRLLLALMALPAPHILMLDEPSNHLDIDSREALVEAINGFRGAIILITHDRQLIELCADRLWLVAGGRCRPFDGDVALYAASRLGSGAEDAKASASASSEGGVRKADRRAAARQRNRAAPLRNAVQAAEAKVTALNERRCALETALADPDLYGDDPARIAALNRDLASVVQSLGEAEQAWLEAAEALERFEGTDIG